MAKLTFWLWFTACLVAALAIYGLQVSANAREVVRQSSDLESQADRVDAIISSARGEKYLRAMTAKQKDVSARSEALSSFFVDRDAQNLDRWFDELKLAWSSEPKRDDFVRFYNINADTLRRETRSALERAKVTGASINLIEYEWMSGRAEPPPATELRRLQREFWIQDRIVRAFARHGGWLSRPMRGGESQVSIGGADAGPRFDRVRYDVQIMAPTARLLDILHALDGPFQTVHEGGAPELLVLHAIIDNISVRRINVDANVASTHEVEPPVEVNFFLTVLDYQGSKS